MAAGQDGLLRLVGKLGRSEGLETREQAELLVLLGVGGQHRHGVDGRAQSLLLGQGNQARHMSLHISVLRCHYRSDNLEGLGARAICFDDAEIVGDWYVHTEDNVWVTDDTLTIQCEATDQ